MTREDLKIKTEQKASKAFSSMFEEKLIYASHDYLESCWGIIVPQKLIKIYCESSIVIESSSNKTAVAIARIQKNIQKNIDNNLWAIWKPSREKAIKSYEVATKLELRPEPFGLLTNLNSREWQFELIEETESYIHVHEIN